MLKTVLEMVVKGFDGLTGLVFIISAFGFGPHRLDFRCWGWTAIMIVLGLNLTLRTVCYFLTKFLCKK